MRDETLPRCKQTFANYGLVNTNIAKNWVTLCKAQHVTPTTVPPEMTRWVDTSNNTFARLNTNVEKKGERGHDHLHRHACPKQRVSSNSWLSLPRPWQSTCEQQKSVSNESGSLSEPRCETSKPSVPSCSRLGAVEWWPPMNARLCASCDSCLTVDSLWQDMARPQVSRWWKVTMTLRLNWMSHVHGFLSLM